VSIVNLVILIVFVLAHVFVCQYYPLFLITIYHISLNSHLLEVVFEMKVYLFNLGGRADICFCSWLNSLLLHRHKLEISDNSLKA